MMPLCSRPFSSSITLSGTRAGRSPSMIWPMTPGAKRAVWTGAPNRPRCAIHPFGSFAGVLRPKVRDRYADESDALGRREDGPDQAKGDLVQPVPGFNARFH